MINAILSRVFATVCGALIASDAKTAVKYIDEKTIVRATWRLKRKAQNRRNEIAITYGAPNYAEREFIKKCKKAGEPLPVKKIQFRFYPKKKAK